MKHRIILSRPMPAAVEAAASQHFDVVLADHILSRAEVVERAHAHEAGGLLFSANLKVDAALLADLPDTLRVAATASVGFDHVDVAAATQRGITITNAPVVTECTADLTMLHIIAACRRAREYQDVMQAGWGRVLRLDELLGTRVSGKTLGIVGMGRIGQAVADRARGFGMKIIYHNRRRASPDVEGDAEYYPVLEDMLPHAQILSLHLPASGSKPLIGATQFARLTQGAIFVNTARGSLVDDDALLAALQSGQVAAAGLDVFNAEPAYDQRLLAFPRVYLTPHVGSATVETRNDLGLRALANLQSVLDGKGAIDPLSAPH